MSSSLAEAGRSAPPAAAPAWKSAAKPAKEATAATITAATAPLPTQPRSLVESAAKSFVESPLGWSASGSFPLSPAWAIVRAQGFHEGTPVAPHFTPFGLQGVDHRAPDAARAGGIPTSPENGPGLPRAASVAKSCGETVPGVLDGDAEDQFEDAPQQRSHGVQRDHPKRCMLEPQVHLGPARGRGGAQCMRPVRNVEHFGAGHHYHAVSGQPVPPAEVHVVSGAGECPIKPFEVFPDVAPHQHSCGVDGEGVGAAVILALVELIRLDQGEPLGPAARGKADVDQPPLDVPVQLLAAGHRDRRRTLHGLQQLRQGLRGGGGIIVQEPDPLGGRLLGFLVPRGQGGKSCGNGSAHPCFACTDAGDAGFAERTFQEGSGIVLRTCIHPDRNVRRPGLVRQCGQGPGEIVTAVMGNHNGSDVYFLKN